MPAGGAAGVGGTPPAGGQTTGSGTGNVGSVGGAAPATTPSGTGP